MDVLAHLKPRMDEIAQTLSACNTIYTVIFMPRPIYNKRRLHEKRFDTSFESIYVETKSEKLKKEENERKLREQEATRESD